MIWSTYDFVRAIASRWRRHVWNGPNSCGNSTTRRTTRRVGASVAIAASARLGPYEIVCAIGAGGMGRCIARAIRAWVYRLFRQVFWNRLARFEREARVLASLNHPNIAAIYGLEPLGGGRALVLELVEAGGRTRRPNESPEEKGIGVLMSSGSLRSRTSCYGGGG